jgi:hypothetical protein
MHRSTMRRTTMLVACTLALALCAGYAAAQTTPPADTLKVDYFANANTAGATDATVRLTDPGTAVGGNLCAVIYVFDSTQEMSECCSCVLSPDGLRTVSVNGDLTSNPLTGVTLTTGAIKIVSTPTAGGVCALTRVLNPKAAIRSWATHIQNGGFAVTETASQDAALSAAEVLRLQTECYGIQLDGSGNGICTCGTGD